MPTDVHFPVSTLALRRGGLVKAVRDRANTLKTYAAFDGVHIDVLGFQPRLESEVAEMKAGGHLHADVQVWSVLNVLDPSPSIETRPVLVLPHQDELVAVQDRNNPQVVRYFRDGLLQLFVRVAADGTPMYVDHFNDERARVKREDLDGSGRVVRVVHYPTVPGGVAVQRYIGRNARCFLTIWQAPGSKDWGQSYLFGRETKHFPNTALMYTYAFEQLLARHSSAAITTEFRENLPILPRHNLDEVVRRIRHPDLRKIVTVHSNHLEQPYVRGAQVSDNWRSTLARLDDYDATVLLTEAQRADVAAQFGHADRLSVIPQVAPPARKSELATDHNRLILVARTHPKKRLDEAVRVFRKVLDANPAATLEVFGFGYKDSEEQLIHDLIQELDVADHVRFMPFSNNPEEIYGSACATLLTSASEGFPLILLESMSFGVPVAAYDSNYGPRDVIVDGENGYLADFEDSDGLARKILQLMQDRELRSSMGKACVSTLDRFDTDQFAARWTKVLSVPSRKVRAEKTPLVPVLRAEWDGNTLVLSAAHRVHPDTKLTIRRRNGNYAALADMVDGQWRLELPKSHPGAIFDAYITSPGHQVEKRLVFGDPHIVQHPRFKVYATKHGSFSIRHQDNKRSARGAHWLRRWARGLKGR